MNLEYLLLPLGIVLLVVPAGVICGAKMRAKLNQPARHINEGLGSLLRSRINWFDLIRGAAGTWLVQKPFADSLSSQDELATTFLIVQMSIVLVGVLAQTLWFHKPVRVIGPVFFLGGLTLVLSGPLTGGFALALGFACALMFRRISSVFTLVPVALVGFGFMFREFGLMTAFNAAAFALPAFLAFTFGTRISFMRHAAEAHDRSIRAVSAQEPVAAPEEAPVIRPDFAHPPAPAPAPARQAVGDPVPLPDFLRIAEEPEIPRRRVRKRLFPLRGA